MLIRYPKPPAGKPAALSYLEIATVEDKTVFDVAQQVVTELSAEDLQKMQELAKPLANQIIPIIQPERLDITAMVLAMLLGQNLAMVVQLSQNNVTLETLVDRIMLSVRANAQASLDEANDTESHRQH